VISVLRAADRFRTELDGITTWHCFSSGAHYDPDNVVFGPVIACDEHLVAPGAGFERHRHTAVELISWVLAGELRHESATQVRTVGPGSVQHQLAGAPLEHAERNASDERDLRFVQLWLLTDTDAQTYDVAPPPTALQAGRFDVLTGAGEVDAGFLFVARGAFTVAGRDLHEGDSLRADRQVLPVTGAGELLVVTVET
jgi:hypothetical protein